VLRAHICRTPKLQVSARAVFFSEAAEGRRGDRAREKRVKSGGPSGRDERESERAIETWREG